MDLLKESEQLKAENEYITNQPKIMIDFPIMCFVNTNNLDNILEVHNLADKDQPRLTFNLDDCRFENFLSLNLL